MNIRKLLEQSRASGPAIEYTTLPDGTREIVSVRPPRPPHLSPALSSEQQRKLLEVTGSWPEILPAPAWCGVQQHDHDAHRTGTRQDRELRAALAESGIMAGPAEMSEQ